MKYYRVEDRLYAAPLDEFDNPIGAARLDVSVREYEVAKVTPKGVWIFTGLGDRRFVLTKARKRFACPTIEEAVESFVARKQAQVRIYSGRVERAKRAIELAKRIRPIDGAIGRFDWLD